MANGDGDTIGQTVINTTYPYGMPINVGDAYSFQPLLLTAIVITGEHEGDYIQFTQGDMSWTSRTTTGVATCTNGGWDPRGGPACGVSRGAAVAVCRSIINIRVARSQTLKLPTNCRRIKSIAWSRVRSIKGHFIARWHGTEPVGFLEFRLL